MRRSVLVALASRHGPAHRVGELVAARLGAHGLAVDVVPAARVGALDRYGAVVVGGPVRLGRWHRDASRFLHRHRYELGRVPVAIFATDNHASARGNGEFERALADAPEVEPVTSAHFAAKRDDGAPRRSAGYDAEEIGRWAEELAHELGA
jgi:menaquinone-dependent protoporphyrinogen IX oxidase